MFLIEKLLFAHHPAASCQHVRPALVYEITVKYIALYRSCSCFFLPELSISLATIYRWLEQSIIILMLVLWFLCYCCHIFSWLSTPAAFHPSISWHHVPSSLHLLTSRDVRRWSTPAAIRPSISWHHVHSPSTYGNLHLIYSWAISALEQIEKHSESTCDQLMISTSSLSPPPVALFTCTWGIIALISNSKSIF